MCQFGLFVIDHFFSRAALLHKNQQLSDMAQLLLHVMDALLQRGTEVPAARCLMQVQIEILENDHVLNKRSTGLSRKSGGLIWDSKIRLELPHIADVREARDSSERFSVRFSLMTEQLSNAEQQQQQQQQQSKLMITVASVLVPLSRLCMRGDVCQRREHILALKSSLGGEKDLARLRVGSLFANADMQPAIDDLLEKAPSSSSAFFSPRRSSAEQELSSKDSGTDYAKRAEAGNQVLLDLQSLAERLEVREAQGPHAGELIVPMLMLIEFLRTRVSREAAREVESKHNSSIVTPRVVIPPDVSMLFDGGLSTTMPALLLSSVAVFVARRLRVSTGATASAESAELKIAVKNVESDLEGIAKETTELQNFFAKTTNVKKQGRNDVPLLELDIIPFLLAVEQKLSELESCIRTEWDDSQKATHQKQLVTFFLAHLSTLSCAVEIKADEVMSKVNRSHTRFTLNNPDTQDFYHIQSFREFRMRIKKSKTKLLSLVVADPAEEFSEVEETYADLPVQRDANSQEMLMDRLSCAFSKRIFDRSLAAFQTLMARTLKHLPAATDSSSQLTDQITQIVSPRREEYSKVVVAATKLSLSFRAIADFVEDKSEEPSVASLQISDPLAEICKAVRLCLDKNSNLPCLAQKCQIFLDLMAKVPTEPTQVTTSIAGNVAIVARLCDIADRHFMHGVDGGAEGATIWSSSVREILLVLFLWPVVSHTADDVSEVFSAMIECGDDGVSLMLVAWMLAIPEVRDILPPVQFCEALVRLFGGSQSPSAGTQEVKAELENEQLSKAVHLIKRCQVTSKTKVPLTENEILAILDSDSALEDTKDFVHQRTLLHLGSDAENTHSLFIEILIRRAKINIDQLDQFGRTAIELAAARGRSDLLSLFIRRGRSGRTVEASRKGRGGKIQQRPFIDNNKIIPGGN